MVINNEGYYKIEPKTFEKAFLQQIADKSGIDYEDVFRFFRYNVISYPQLQLITKETETNLRNMTRGTLKGRGDSIERITKLDEINAFPDSKNGKLFVLVNDKCINFIKRKLDIE